jgi:predicted negative regulator of RcsB-dependent stress response
VLAQVAVQYATIKVLQNNPDRAPRVIEIAQFIRANAGNEQAATVALLEAAVRSQIDFSKLDPADAMLVDILIATVREELVQRLGDGPLSPEHVLVVAQVAGWIESAALLSAPRA